MSSNILTFENTFTPVKKAKELDNGYYSVNAGAYGVFNRAGVKYASDNIEKLFDNTSVLQKRINEKTLFSEWGHPVMTGLNATEQEMRHLKIQEDRICGHIRKAFLVDGENGASKITRIEVCPFGEHKQITTDIFNNSDMNAFFSVRSLSNRRQVNGVLVKYVYYLVTWDLVGMGGIPHACELQTNYKDSEEFNLVDYVQTQELNSIDLDNTTEIRYILNNIEEYKKSNSLDNESSDTIDIIKQILSNAIIVDDEDAIFNLY